MSATTENDKDHDKGAKDNGESEELKQTNINPDSVQSQDKTQQNLQMEQEGSPSEEISEPPSANNFEKDQMIEDLRSENRILKEQYKELKEAYEKLKTENNDPPKVINVPNQVQTGRQPEEDKWNAEICGEYIVSYLESIGIGFKWHSLDKENDIYEIPESSGFYMMFLKSVSEGTTVRYPIFVGVAKNLKNVLLVLKSTRDNIGKSIFSRVLGDSIDFPKNRNQIEGLESKLHICMLGLTYPTSKCLKEIFLGNFNFCFNKKMNSFIRLEMDISAQKENDEVINYIRGRGTWKKGIDECKKLEIS